MSQQQKDRTIRAGVSFIVASTIEFRLRGAEYNNAFGVSVAAIVTLLEMLGYTEIFSGFVWPLLRSIFESGVIEVVAK